MLSQKPTEDSKSEHEKEDLIPLSVIKESVLLENIKNAVLTNIEVNE